ncbi:MAG: hypothetical protein AAGU76_00330 [Sedimentibacter sp.]|uniref:hypothetical protein n=1 Tax=Sedimentibacter sp. TaxID=1960295 RepID=UPI003157F89D
MSKENNNDDILQEDLEFTAKYIRENSYNGKFIKYDDFFKEPISLKKEDKEKFFEKLLGNEEFSDIKELKGKENRYFYSAKEMNENYAKLIYRIEEKDILNMVADRIRTDSKRYPKTTNSYVFLNEPYNLKKDELAEIYKQLSNMDEYKDIMQSRASNGVICMFSDKFLSQTYADALTELQEVTRVESQ